MIDPLGGKQARDAYVGRAGSTPPSERTQSTQSTRSTRSTQAERATGRAAEQAAAQEHEEGPVQVSEGLRRIQRATDAVKESPDVRAERVAEIRKRIEAGDYSVSSAQVAAKLLGLPDGNA